MSLFCVHAGTLASGNPKVAGGPFADRKAAVASLRGLPVGKYDLVKVVEAGLEVREPKRSTEMVVARGEATMSRKRNSDASASE
jgi:hypothetical protein